MGSLSLGGSSSNKSMNQDSTRTPVISPNYNEWFNNLTNSVNPSTGATPGQTTSADWIAGNLQNNLVDQNIEPINRTLTDIRTGLGQLNAGALNNIIYGAPTLSTAATSSGAPNVTAQTGASMSQPYADLFSQQYIDPTLSAFDYGAGKSINQLNAAQAAAGAFGNDRSGFAYNDLITQLANSRGQLEANAKLTGLNSAFGLGQTDANRYLTADATNAANTMANNQFNASQLQQNNQFNSNLALQNNAQKLQAINQVASNLQAGANLTQQQMGNIVTANGIDTNAATTMFNEGTITQAQLLAILSAAGEYNGSQTNASGSSSESGFKFGLDLGKS